MSIKEWLFGKKAFSPPTTSMMLNGIPIYDKYSSFNTIDKGYLSSDDVYSIVRRIAKTAAMIPLTVYKVKDEGALKDYEYVSKQHNHSTQVLLQKQIMKYKAMEPVPANNPLQIILDNPNPLFNKTDFREGVYTFRLITGNTYIHTPMIDLGVNAGKPLEMWLLPSQYTQPVVTQTFPREITNYQMNMFGIVEIPTSEIIHLKYFNPFFSQAGDELIGLSPLRAGAKIVTRANAEADYLVSSFQNSGISGIASNESLNTDEVTAETLSKMKSDFYGDSSGTRNARKIMMTVGKWTYTQIGLGPVDMDVLNSEVKTFKKLCNLYGVSDVLFNNGEAATESNVKEMIKQMYTNAALPEVYALRDALNQVLTPKYTDGKNKYFIDCDITAIPELQDDMKDMALIFSTLPIMNPNLIAEAYGWGKQTDPLMNKFYIKTGYTELDNLSAVEALPLMTPNGN